MLSQSYSSLLSYLHVGVLLHHTVVAAAIDVAMYICFVLDEYLRPDGGGIAVVVSIVLATAGTEHVAAIPFVILEAFYIAVGRANMGNTATTANVDGT